MEQQESIIISQFENIWFSTLLIKELIIFISNLVNLDGKRSKNFRILYSPYLIDGTAGIIQMLLRINPVKYIDLSRRIIPIPLFLNLHNL